MECSHNCSTCGTHCIIKCPVCGAKAIPVPGVTVYNLTDNKSIPTKKHYICTNPNCDIVYIEDGCNQLYTKSDVNVPIWFKSDFFNYMICYCRKIYLKEIIQAVFSIENPTKDNIIKFLGKEKTQKRCPLQNPIGRSCDDFFEDAIKYAIDLKNKQE